MEFIPYDEKKIKEWREKAAKDQKKADDKAADGGKKPKKGKRPEFVFPVSVTLDDGSTKAIANVEELKAYHESLAKGVRPTYVFPLSIIKNGETIVINSQEELDALCGK